MTPRERRQSVVKTLRELTPLIIGLGGLYYAHRAGNLVESTADQHRDEQHDQYMGLVRRITRIECKEGTIHCDDTTSVGGQGR